MMVDEKTPSAVRLYCNRLFGRPDRRFQMLFSGWNKKSDAGILPDLFRPAGRHLEQRRSAFKVQVAAILPGIQ